MNIKEIGIYGWVPYVGAMIGAWFGGLLAQNRMKAGWNTNKTRKAVITLGCLIMLPCFWLLTDPGSPVNAVIIMAVILFGFQTAIGNIQTLPSDLFGKKTVGTLSGFAGMSAKFAGVGLTSLVATLTMGGNYTPAFIVGAVLTLIVLASVWFLIRKIEPLQPKTI
jgi:ACS family hexuronate transporter-like MFS transporter